MQFLTLATTLFLAGLAAARPESVESLQQRSAGPGWAGLTFKAAAGVTYFQSIPVDGQEHAVNSRLSFTAIGSDAQPSVTCISYGVDGSQTVLVGTVNDVPIGPPQLQYKAKCHY